MLKYTHLIYSWNSSINVNMMMPSYNINYYNAGGKWATSLEVAYSSNAILGITISQGQFDLLSHYYSLQEMELAGAQKMSKKQIYDVSALIVHNEKNRYVKARIKHNLKELKNDRLENHSRKFSKLFYCFVFSQTYEPVFQTDEDYFLADFLELDGNSEKIQAMHELYEEIKKLKIQRKNESDISKKTIISNKINLLESEYKQSEKDIISILADISTKKDVLEKIPLTKLIIILKPLLCNFCSLQNHFIVFYRGKAFFEVMQEANELHKKQADSLKNEFYEKETLELLKNENALIELLDQAINLTGCDDFNILYTETENRMKELIQNMPENIFFKAITSDDFRPETVGEKLGTYSSAASIFKAVKKEKHYEVI